MATYNHPLSYSGPEINATLIARNGGNAPIHLALTETKNCKVKTHSLTILQMVDGWPDKFVCNNLPRSFDNFGYNRSCDCCVP